MYIEKAIVLCSHPGCPALVEPGTRCCEIHRAQLPGRNPASVSQRIRKEMAAGEQGFLTAHPLCVRCAGERQYVKADVADHIIPHRGDSVLVWDEVNCQALCK